MKRIMWCGFFGLAALLPLGCAAEQAPNAVKENPRWEYRVLKLDETSEKDLANLLARQGMEGWEYVGVVAGKDEQLVFKRPMLGRMGGGYPVGVTAVSPRYGATMGTAPERIYRTSVETRAVFPPKSTAETKPLPPRPE